MKNRMLKSMIVAECLLIFASAELTAGPAASAGKAVIKTAVEAGAKRSGKALTPALRVAAEKSLTKAAARYGDDAVLAVRKGGLEVLDAGVRHGDDFWRLCAKSSDDAAFILARNADEFMPIIRRTGPEFLKLEATAPGLGKRAISVFGEQSVKPLSKIPQKDLHRLLGYAERAESPAVAKSLLEGYEKTGGKILDHLDWKHIMAYGLSASMVVAAYKIGGGVEEGLKISAEKAPESFLSTLSRPVRYGLYALFAILLLPVYSLCRRLQKKIQAKPRDAERTKAAAENSQKATGKE